MAAARRSPKDREAFLALVQSAIKKHSAKQPLTARESRALEKWEVGEDERRGRRWMSALPKGVYCELVGRQPKIVNEQATMYGVPLHGASVDVSAVLRWLHDFFATHKHVLPRVLRSGGSAMQPRDQLIVEQIEVYRRRVRLLENRIAQEESTLIPRSEIHWHLAQIAKVLRGATEKLHRQFGSQAASIIENALEDYSSSLERMTPKNDQGMQNSGNEPTADAP